MTMPRRKMPTMVAKAVVQVFVKWLSQLSEHTSNQRLVQSVDREDLAQHLVILMQVPGIGCAEQEHLRSTPICITRIRARKCRCCGARFRPKDRKSPLRGA